MSKHVAEGAFREFGTSIKNWHDPKHSAGPPRFHKKRITGSGSFRAAAGVTTIKYNGKRRIQLPGLGSIKLDHTLPEGIIYEAHVKRENGQWKLSVNYWKAPETNPIPTSAGRSAQSIHFETQYNHVSPEDLDIKRQCRVGPTKSHDIQA